MAGAAKGKFMLSAERKPTPISGLEMRVLAGELSRLSGWYVSSIHSLGENQVFRLKSPEGDADVIVSPTLGSWVTSHPAHGTTSEFTTALRGELSRLRLETVEQLGLDRVLSFRFSDGEKVVKLIVELMPPGNIVLTDTEGVVIVALREFRSTRRTIGRGRRYAPPPQNRASPEALDEASLRDIVTRDKTVGKALGRGLSFPRRYVDEILAKVALGQEQETPLPEEKVREIGSAIKSLLAAMKEPTPSLVEGASGLELMMVSPVHGTVVETAPSMSELMDKAFVNSLLETATEQPRQDKEAKEVEVTLSRLERQVFDLRSKAASLRRAAEAAMRTGSAEDAIASLSHESLEPELRDRLKRSESSAAIASLLFDEAKAAENEVKRIEQVSEGLANRLRRRKKVASKPQVKLVVREKKEWYEKFRWFFTSEGKLAVGGRDAQSNTILVKKHMGESDVAYHADLFGSPFFILKDGKNQSSSDVRQLGQATAAFSSAWKTGLSAADAYWVQPDQVSSSAPSGEYLAKGSFVIRGKKNFVNKNPVELAVGVDDQARLVCGPEEAVMKHASAYLVLIPNREKSSDTAKKVVVELKKLYGDAFGASVDDVLRALPSGGGKIVRKRDTRATMPQKQDPQ